MWSNMMEKWLRNSCMKSFFRSQPVRKGTVQWDSQFLQLHSYLVWHRAAWRETILSDTQQFEERSFYLNYLLLKPKQKELSSLERRVKFSPSVSGFLKAIKTLLHLAWCYLSPCETLEGLLRNLKNEKIFLKKKVSRTQALILYLWNFIAKPQVFSP